MRGGGGVAGVAEWAAPPFLLNGANVAERGQPQTLPAQLRGGAGSESRPPKSQGTCGRNWTGWPSRAEPRSWNVPLRVPGPASYVAAPGRRGSAGGKPARAGRLVPGSAGGQSSGAGRRAAAGRAACQTFEDTIRP